MAGLAQDGKVDPGAAGAVRRDGEGKPWTPSTLQGRRRHGGVGVTFLEETFSATTAPPEHRLHQKAAQAVLKALLPEAGADIKGQMRSEPRAQTTRRLYGPPRGFPEAGPDPRPGASPDHAHRSRGLHRRSRGDIERRMLLPVDPRLPGGSSAKLAYPKAAGDPEGSGGASPGRAGGALERQAREPPSAHVPGMGRHPAADVEERVERTTNQNDEAGGASVRSSWRRHRWP